MEKYFHLTPRRGREQSDLEVQRGFQYPFPPRRADLELAQHRGSALETHIAWRSQEVFQSPRGGDLGFRVLQWPESKQWDVPPRRLGSVPACVEWYPAQGIPSRVPALTHRKPPGSSTTLTFASPASMPGSSMRPAVRRSSFLPGCSTSSPTMIGREPPASTREMMSRRSPCSLHDVAGEPRRGCDSRRHRLPGGGVEQVRGRADGPRADPPQLAHDQDR